MRKPRPSRPSRRGSYRESVAGEATSSLGTHMILDVKAAVDASPWGLGNDAAAWNGAPYAFLAVHESIWEYEERTTLVDEHKARLGLLTSDHRMTNVWKNLKRREASRVPRERPAVHWVKFYHEIMAALKKSSRPRWSTTKLQGAHADIERQSRKLSAALRQLYDRELTDITAFLDSSTVRNLALSLRVDTLSPPPADVDPEHELKRGLRFLPSLPELLDLLAERAKLHAPRTPMHSRPESRGAQHRPFIQHMSDYFFSRYGARLHKTVATITAVIFGMNEDAVSVDRVRGQLRRAAR
jgi:hypothetical protein